MKYFDGVESIDKVTIPQGKAPLLSDWGPNKNSPSRKNLHDYGNDSI